MPVYRHKLTGMTQELLPEQAEIFGDNFELVKDAEGATERDARLRREAIENKVELVMDDEENN